MNKLDNILKQQMETFAPDAPNIWAGIEQGVQANAAAQTATVAKTVGSKLAITIAKIVAMVAIPASLVVYITSNENSNAAKNSKVAHNISIPITTNPIEIKAVETPIIENAKVENKGVTHQKTVSAHKNDKSILIHKAAADIVHVYSNKPSNTEQINTFINSENNKTINTPNEINNFKIGEEILDENEVAELEKKEANDETNDAENAIGIKTLPNVFTPDNDGINDKYVIDLEGEKYYNLKIYNYNNELVFESNDKNTNWDGINFKNGQACNSGIYYGILLYKLTNNDKILTRMTKIKLHR